MNPVDLKPQLLGGKISLFLRAPTRYRAIVVRGIHRPVSALSFKFQPYLLSLTEGEDE